MRKNAFVTGAPLRTRWGSSQHSPDSLTGFGRRKGVRKRERRERAREGKGRGRETKASGAEGKQRKGEAEDGIKGQTPEQKFWRYGLVIVQSLTSSYKNILEITVHNLMTRGVDPYGTGGTRPSQYLDWGGHYHECPPPPNISRVISATLYPCNIFLIS